MLSFKLKDIIFYILVISDIVGSILGLEGIIFSALDIFEGTIIFIGIMILALTIRGNFERKNTVKALMSMSLLLLLASIFFLKVQNIMIFLHNTRSIVAHDYLDNSALYPNLALSVFLFMLGFLIAGKKSSLSYLSESRYFGILSPILAIIFLLATSEHPEILLAILLVLLIYHIKDNKIHPVLSAFRFRKSSVLLLLAICFIFASFQVLLINYSRISAIEAPLIKNYDSIPRIFVDYSRNSFIEMQNERISEYLGYDGCSDMSCFDEKIDEKYTRFMADDEYLLDSNISSCIQDKNKECIESNLTYPHCFDSMLLEKECLHESIRKESRSIVSSSMASSLVYSLTVSNSYEPSGLSSSIALILDNAFTMSVASIKSSMIASTLYEWSDVCRARFHDSGYDLSVSLSCNREYMRYHENLSRELETMIVYPDLGQDVSCSPVYNINQNFILESQNSLDTTMPVSRYLRLQDLYLRSKCMHELNKKSESKPFCVEPKSLFLTSYALSETMISSGQYAACVANESRFLGDNYEELFENAMD